VDIQVGGKKAQVIHANNVFYGWRGDKYVELVAGQTALNVGVAGAGVLAQEFGNSYQHTTVLTVDQAAAITLADNASLADGSLIYTFPAGALFVNSSFMNMLVTNAEHNAEATDIGLGTAVATGAVSVLGGTAGFENIMTGQTGAVGTATVAQALAPNSPFALNIGAGNPHSVYLNVAGAWANTAGVALDADFAGVVILNWTFLG